jgi:hypothetical protein
VDGVHFGDWVGVDCKRWVEYRLEVFGLKVVNDCRDLGVQVRVIITVTSVRSAMLETVETTGRREPYKCVRRLVADIAGVFEASTANNGTVLKIDHGDWACQGQV